MVTWNPHIFIFGCCEDFLMGISCEYNLFFKGRMESEIGEANTHPDMSGSFSVGEKIVSWVFQMIISVQPFRG